MQTRSKSIGLVLSGGGVRGMAHIGVIKAMQEFGLEATVVAGSSVGALVGALYSADKPIEDMLHFFKDTPLFKYNYFAVAKPGLINTERFISAFQQYFPEDSFEALKKDLHVVATNLEQGEEVFINKGELIRPLLASAALPPVFSPIEYNGALHADGGIMNNFPSEPILSRVEYVIGSNVSLVSKLEKKHLNNSFQLTGRVTGLMIYAINREKINNCNLIIEPQELENIGILDRRGIEKAYAIGYETAVRTFEKVL
ncbi:patatin-like phospholipase family protein [Maribacter arcticus]|uniref:NTE family protein n=1 Tax=Maribacter arcticus TaxID=561365 RepID=A0A1T5BVZ0_9FLAO|nr:patatin-like phospholipase family protein [Maribacter arcticus]SKB51259.1 NTE family protein [Maribacter arcticus]|tara:strand:- start:1125 stop:1892 length:768 start_codon:yes stop_codon:yes gene_type:complete